LIYPKFFSGLGATMLNEASEYSYIDEIDLSLLKEKNRISPRQ
jgi:hypothetical protein